MALKHAARRALLVPFRLTLLMGTLLAVLAVLAWNLHTTRALLEEQDRRMRFMGEQGWRLSMRPSDDGAESVQKRIADLPIRLLPMAPDARPTLAMLSGVHALRAPNGPMATHHPVLIAAPSTGLPGRDERGATPCVWLGPQRPDGEEWIVDGRMRCRMVPTPAGWASLNSELDGAALVVPFQAASLLAGADWAGQVAKLLVAGGNNPCAGHPQLLCERFAVTHAAGVTAGLSMSMRTRWSLPLVLLAALVAVVIYLAGLRPVMQREFALRLALGLPLPAALRWIVSAQMAQVVWLMLGVGMAAAALIRAMSMAPSSWEWAWGTAWLSACALVGAVQALLWGWLGQREALRQLGRVE
jgi:hypothetical protein